MASLVCHLAALVLTLSLTSALEQVSDLEANVNPIRKVVTMLHNIKAKVEAEGDKEQAMFKKFQCYCKNSGASVSKSVEEANRMIPQLQSDIKSLSSKKEQLESTLSDNTEAEKAAKEAVAKATAVHDQAHSKAVEEVEVDQVSIDALKTAVHRSNAAGFLQSSSADTLRRIAAIRADIPDVNRSRLLAFLAGERQQAEDEGTGSGEIVGVLEGIRERVQADQDHVKEDDRTETHEYEELAGAKKKEIAALEENVQIKTQRVGNLGVTIAKDETDLEDYEESLAEDKKLQNRLGAVCDEKLKEFEDNARLRSLELKALAETIEMLTSDDARELLAKARPGSSSSLLQQSAGTAWLVARARAVLLQKASPSTRIDLLALAMQGKKLGLAKVIKMIDEMKATLEKEQVDDEAKKEYCEKELDSAKDKKKWEEREASDISAAIEEAKEELGALEDNLETMKAGLAEQDELAKDAMEQREQENAEYKELMATNAAAKELLTKAKEKMSKFYSSAEPVVLAQVFETSRRLRASPDAPKAAGEYSPSNSGGTVISALNMIIADLEKEIVVAKTQEENAQEEYEQTVKEAAAKRAADEKTLADEAAQKADLKAELEKHVQADQEVKTDIQGLEKYAIALHHECDFIMKFFDTRKEARQDEIDGLMKARSVLANVD